MLRVLYKITSKDNQSGLSHQLIQWGEGITNTACGAGQLCSSAYLHAYTTPLLAVLFNPIHANISEFNLWHCVGKVEKWDGTKVGCTVLKTIKCIHIPEITTKQKVAFGIYCALHVYKEINYRKWANDWLAAAAPARAAAYAAAARADADAADADAAYVATARAAAYAAARAADAAAYAARAAARAAAYAVDAARAAACAAARAADTTTAPFFISHASRRALKY